MKFDFQKDRAALKADDRSAFNLLMEDYYGWSVTQVRKIIHDPERAKDVAVTFWEQLPVKLEQYDSERLTFVAWMEQCLRNMAVDGARVKQPKVSYTSDPQDVRSEEQDVTKQISARQDLDAVAGKLKSAQHKDTFWLLLNGASVKDIAFECDVSESRARALIADVRAVIETQINQE